MSIVRSTLRDDVMKQADAFGAQRWDVSAGGEVDRRISGVYDKIWRRILNANRFYRAGKRTPTSDAVTGRYALTDLDAGAGNTQERFYRILQIIVDGVRYGPPGALTDYNNADDQLDRRVAYLEGTNLAVFPLQLSKAADAIWVNWIPQRPAALAADTDSVVFPDGHEEVLVVLSAARLLMKGGAETQASLELKNEVAEDYEELLQDVARLSTDPLVMQFSDNASEWAG